MMRGGPLGSGSLFTVSDLGPAAGVTGTSGVVTAFESFNSLAT